MKNASVQNNSQIHFEFFIVFKLEKWVENKKNARSIPFQNDVSIPTVLQLNQNKVFICKRNKKTPQTKPYPLNKTHNSFQHFTSIIFPA